MNVCLDTGGKPSVCFVSLDNFAALVDDPQSGHIGGAEVQQSLIGRELVKRGYRVSFITLDHGQDSEIEIDGMRIIKAYNPNMGIRMLRFLHPRLTGLWHAMKRADADIYYQRTQDSVTGLVAAFCQRHRRRFVFAVAANADCVGDLPYSTARHERALFRYGLRRAHVVIAQTVTQQRLLHENFGIESLVIPNCAPDHHPHLRGADTLASGRERNLLWVGSFGRVKRLELLLDIAEQHRDLQFDIVGDGNGESAYVQELCARAKAMPHVHLHGTVPHTHIQQFYQRAAALICTSRSEGFPNIFLEAWSHGLPVVTTFDPDGMVASQGLGKVGKDAAEVGAGIRELLDSPAQWQEMSRRARQFYLQNFTVEATITKFERTLAEVSKVHGIGSVA